MKTFLLFCALICLGCGSGSTTEDVVNSDGSDGNASAVDTTGQDDGDGETPDGTDCIPDVDFCDGLKVMQCLDGEVGPLIKTCGVEELCEDGQCVCKPNCDGRVCGDDGCDGLCGKCGSQEICTDAGLCDCVPSCEGKECGGDGCGGPCGGGCEEGVECSPNGICGCVGSCDGKSCGDDGCGVSCGECGAGVACSPNGICGCTPDCAGKTCDHDGCGGLCNSCLDISYDDGSVETARGWMEEPDDSPAKAACVVRYDLPFKGMKLTRFLGRWMWGLVSMGTPFELAFALGDDVACKQGNSESWYLEYCEIPPDKLFSIGEFKPLASGAEACGKDSEGDPKACTLLEAEQLGEITFQGKTVFMATIFTVDQYPFLPCPIDQDSDGKNAFFMPLYDNDGSLLYESGALLKQDGNVGTIPFKIRVQLDD